MEANTVKESTKRYAFLQPLYMTKIIDKVVKAVPGAIIDFDITEDGRCVGLQFLSILYRQKLLKKYKVTAYLLLYFCYARLRAFSP